MTKVTGNSHENSLSFDDTPGIQQLALQITYRFCIDIAYRFRPKHCQDQLQYSYITTKPKLKIKLLYPITIKQKMNGPAQRAGPG